MFADSAIPSRCPDTRDLNRDLRRATDKYRFNSREVRTEVDEELIRQVQSTESHKYEDEREADSSRQQQTHNNRFRQQTTADSDSRQQQIQTAADSDRQQIQTAILDSGKQNYPDK
ncbi:hypothetical protein Tco_0805541 [Tanacetum coccineum]